MAKIATITEISTNDIIYKEKIIGYNVDNTYLPAEDYLEEAWENAVDVGLVDADRRSDYLIEIIDSDEEDDENVEDYIDLDDDQYTKEDS